MAFFIKSFESITASLIQKVSQTTSGLTDFNIGSKVRTILEAFSQELEQFYHQMFRGILEAIDTSVYNSFDFAPLAAISATGKVVFTLVEAGTNVPLAPTSNITIPSGFRVQVPIQANISLTSNSAPSGTTYTVLKDTVWLAGQTSVSATAVCVTAGIVGNTIPDSVTGIVDILPAVQGGQYKVTNPVPFVDGRDQEDELSRKARFAKYLQSLGRGTSVALEYAALTATVTDSNGSITEQVKRVVAVEPYILDGSLPVGHVNIYIYNGVGFTSSALVSACQQIINGYTDTNNNRIAGYKAAGIIAKVQAATEIATTFDIRVKMASGYSLTSDVSNQIKSSIAKYVSTLNPGDPLVFHKIIELVMDTPGIYNCIVASPTGDVVLTDLSNIITINNILVTEDATLTIVNETFTT